MHWKPPRPETFSGDSKQDLNTWLGTVELYAYNAEVADEEKAEMAAGYLTGNAARAFLNACSAANMRCITDWETFCDVLRSDFGQIFESHQARNKLEKLSQTGRADGYIRAFKNLINQMADDPMAQSDQVRFFYKGLKPHLQRDCKSDPSTGGPFKSLDKIMNHALSLEMSGNPKEGKDPTSDNRKRKGDSDDKSNKKGKSNSGRSKSTFYQEGSDELAYARENNLCLHCAKSGHITKECRHKKAGRPATPIVVPADWTRKGDGNRQVPETLSSAQINHELIASIISVEVKSLEDLSNKPFSAIAPRANSSAFHMLLKEGSHVLSYEEDVESLTQYLEIYRMQKEKDPSISAVFVVPTSLGGWRSLLKGFKPIKDYKKGETILLAREGTHKSIEQNMHVFYDPPKLPDTLRMLVKGLINGSESRILLDTGASRSAISAKKVSRLTLPISSHPPFQVSGYDGETKIVNSATQAMLRMGSYEEGLYLPVMMMPRFDIILGQDWLQAHRSVLSYDGDNVLSFKHLGKIYSVPHENTLVQDLAALGVALITAHTVMKCLSNPQTCEKAFMALVRESPSEDIMVHEESQLNPAVKALIDDYPEILTNDPPVGLPKGHTVHAIPLQNEGQTVYRNMYRLAPKEREEVQRQVTDFLNRGIIRPSTSPFGSPVLFVPKPDGTQRMCIDYRAVNKITIKNRYPMPRVDDLFDRLQGAKYFSSLDLLSGYHQIKIKESDIPKTAFNTHMGHYEFLVLPFGLTNAPATFQNLMNEIIPAELHHFCLVYLDDILIFSKTEDDHEKHLRLVLDILRKHKLIARLCKCAFYKESIKWLGHIISENGVAVDTRKTQAVQDWPTPTSIKELQQFLGLANYFRKFMQGYSKLVAPLTDLLKKGSLFQWNAEQNEAFEGIKYSLTHAPVLALPDFGKHFVLQSDASGYGLGAVLTQEGRPIAYHSRKMNDHEFKYSGNNKELLAAYDALRTFRPYLLGVPFTFITDHKPHTGNLKCEGHMQVKWITYLAEFDANFIYKPGKTNVADPLSRSPALLCVMETRRKKRVYLSQEHETSSQERGREMPRPSEDAIELGAKSPSPYVNLDKNHLLEDDEEEEDMVDLGELPQPPNVLDDLEQRIKDGYENDPWFKDEANLSKLTKKDGFRFSKDLCVVPNDPSIKDEILFEFHGTPIAGHVGSERTRRAVMTQFWWPRIEKEVNKYVAECPTCQKNKASHQKPGGLYQPLPIPKQKWTSISMDFIVQLPKTNKGHDAIFVVVDRLTKMAHFIPTKTTATAEDTAELFRDNIFKLHGLPEDIVSDRDSKFVGHFWECFCKMLGIKRNLSSPYHPQSDGQTERMNRILEDMLRHWVGPDHDDWDQFLSCCEFAVNNAFQKSIGTTPFMLNYGHHPRMAMQLFAGKDVPSAEKMSISMQGELQAAKACMQRAQDRQRAYADKDRREVEFEKGQYVYLSSKNIRFRGKGTPKLMPKYMGPYKIEKKIGHVAYRLELPPKSGIHPTFHVSLLKPHKGSLENLEKDEERPEPIIIGTEKLFIIEKLIDHKDVKSPGKKGTLKRSYLVRWKGYPPSEDSWEPENALKGKEPYKEYWRAQQARGRPAA